MTVYEKLLNIQLDMALVLQRLEARQKIIGCVSNEDDILLRTCKAVYEILDVLAKTQAITSKTAATINGDRPLKNLPDEAVIEAAERCFTNDGEGCYGCPAEPYLVKTTCESDRVIEELCIRLKERMQGPTAKVGEGPEPAPDTGEMAEWIESGIDPSVFRCSQCRRLLYNPIDYQFRFCPGCGTRMKNGG